MNETARVKPVDGQCGTCLFAKEFGYSSSPSGPEDGVHCISYHWAKRQDDLTHGNTKYIEELIEDGFVDILRLETLAEEVFRCPSWLSKDAEVKEQLLPAPDEAPVTSCPWCGKEYNIKEDDPRLHYDTLVVFTPGNNEIARHKDCGQLVKFA